MLLMRNSDQYPEALAFKKWWKDSRWPCIPYLLVSIGWHRGDALP
jgi:hypothetical protein